MRMGWDIQNILCPKCAGAEKTDWCENLKLGNKIFRAQGIDKVRISGAPGSPAKRARLVLVFKSKTTRLRRNAKFNISYVPGFSV